MNLSFRLGALAAATGFLAAAPASAAAQDLLVPMDAAQGNHLRAYGLTYWVLEGGASAEWLLNYRGGGFLLPDTEAVRREAAFRGVDIESVEPQKDDRGQKRNPLVAVAERVPGPDSEGAGGGETRQIRIPLIRPPLPRACQRRLERVLVTDADQATVFTHLVKMDSLDHQPGNPPRLRPGHFASSLSASR